MTTAISIRPSKDLRTNYAEISRLCRTQPVAVTVNGKEDIIIQSHEDYMNNQIEMAQLRAELSVFQTLAQAEDDIKLGRVSTLENAQMTALNKYIG